MPKKIVFLAAALIIILLMVAYTFYSFSSRIDALQASHDVIEEENRQASIYNSARCLSPEALQQSLTAISDIYHHTLYPFVLSASAERVLSDSFRIIVSQGIDCQLTGQEKRLLTWPISSTSAEQHNNFLATGKQLAEFILKFSVFETTVVRRKELVNPSDDTLQPIVFNDLLSTLYPQHPVKHLPNDAIVNMATTEPFSVDPIVAKEISEHIHLSLNAIDAQLKEQLGLGTQWVNALLDAQINSKNIARLSQWFYWVDGLPNQCQQLTETLVPLLNTASTSPILLNHGEKVHASFTLNQHAVNDCPATAQTLTTAINNTLSDQPFLLSARGVNSGLVSSHWLAIAEAIEQLANLSLIVHSSLVEDTAETFSCKTTTTDWDDQTAVLMEKYSQEAINFLAQDQTLSRALEKNDFKEALILNKLSMLINTLGNTAQNNLSITPSTTLTGRLNELAQSSERFSRFLPSFSSTINYTETLGISDSMRELTICVGEHTRNQWLNIVNIAESNILLKRPNNHETDVGDIHPFSSEDELEQWWDEELQALEALFEYSAPYMSYLSNLKREDTNNLLSPALASWENAQKEKRDYQDANDNNQVSQLYSLYKKAIKLEKQECDNFLQENSRLFSEFGSDIFSQRRQTYAAEIRIFCNE